MARKIDGLRRLVRVYAQHLDSDAQVVRFYAQILGLDPDDAEAQEVLIEKYEAMRKWQDLVAILQRQADQAEGEGPHGPQPEGRQPLPGQVPATRTRHPGLRAGPGGVAGEHPRPSRPSTACTRSAASGTSSWSSAGSSRT
ncbi:MAG: hypothetical protein R3F43_08685 [bacterium]